MRTVMSAVFATLALSFSAVGSPSAKADEVFELHAANPQPGAEDLEPGLGVYYAYGDVGETNELATAKAWLDRVEEPKRQTLPHLNFEDGPKTLTSDHGVHTLAQIDGYVRLSKGQYTYAIWSNDGVRVALGGEVIYEDDDRHPCDNALGSVTVSAPEDGWYELSILYFNRNGTSCLIIEDENEEPLPPESLAHKKFAGDAKS